MTRPFKCKFCGDEIRTPGEAMIHATAHGDDGKTPLSEADWQAIADMRADAFEGTIARIDDLGTIVQVWLQGKDGFIRVVFDHRPFHHFADAQGGELIGRKVRVTGQFGEQVIETLD